MSEIVFVGEIYKVQTLEDYGIRITIDLPEDAIPQMAMLAEARREGIPLRFRASADIISTSQVEEDAAKGKRGRRR
jgi:hypothetical protein